MQTHTIIIIPAAEQAPANEQARLMQFGLDGTNNGANTFRVPVYAAAATDDSTPAGYWIGAAFSVAARAAVEQMKGPLNAIVQDYDPAATPNFPATFLAQQGYRTAKMTAGGKAS